MTVIFQALEWKDYNETDPNADSDSESDSDSEEYSENKDKGGKGKEFVLRVFGCTKQGESVTLTVKGIRVYFYIKVPKYYEKPEFNNILNYIQFRLRREYKNNLIKKECLYTIKKDFYGFKGDDTFKFIKVVFNNSDAMKQASNMFNEKVQIKNVTMTQTKFNCYESNVDPIIRFIHDNNLQTAGWLYIDKYNDNDIANTEIDIITNKENVKAVSDEDSHKFGTAPFMQASFDIEVYSQFITIGTLLCKKGSIEVLGKQTRFTQQLRNSFTITVPINNKCETRTVVKVISDTQLIINEPFSDDVIKKIAEINKDKDITKESGASRNRQFPSANIPGNYVTQIGTTFKRYGSKECLLKHIITLKECGEIENEKLENGEEIEVIVESYDTEKEVLLAWRDLIIKADPDIIYSYNGDGFDCDYMVTRAKMLGIDDKFMYLGKIEEEKSVIKKETFSSGAYGTRHYKRLKIPGRVNFDVYIYIMREKKLNSYKLDDVAKKFLNQQKHSVTASDIFNYFQEGTPEKIKVIAEYCIQDTVLPQRLMDKMDILPIQIEMANVTYVPLRYLFERGQQIKVFSQIIKVTKRMGYLVPHLKQRWWKPKLIYKKDDVIVYKPKFDDTDIEFTESNFIALQDSMNQPPLLKRGQGEKTKLILNRRYWNIYIPEKFKGATVLDPMVGAHWDAVTTLDFASLYPSIMIAFLLCYTTIVLEKKYANIKGVEYEDIEWDEGDKHFKIRYAKTDNSILPSLLKDLLSNRRRVKEMMENETDPFIKSILNGRQLALKVSCNSVYGFLAAQMLQCKDIGRCVTTIGRKMIEDTKNYLENDYPQDAIDHGLTDKLIKTKVVYGDSVTSDTPIVLKKYDKIFTSRIDSIDCNWVIDGEKYYGIPKEPIYTWTEDGWTKVKSVMKHKTQKEIHRILTHSGCIDVTSDHSLIDINLKCIKPTDCVVGTKLLHKTPIINSNESYISLSEAWIFGFFMGDGSCNSYKNGNTVKYTWALNNKSIDICERIMEHLNNAYSDRKFKILDTIKSSNVYKIVPIVNIKDLVIKYRKLFYNNFSEKIVPECILSSSKDIKESFWKGYYEADGDKDIKGYTRCDIKGYTRCDIKGKEGALGLYLLLTGLDFKVSINTRTDKPSIYRLTCTTGTQRKCPNSIKKIQSLGFSNDYVYDLTTENHHFQAGVGNIIAHNTDSCMVKFKISGATGLDQVRESFKHGKLAGKLATQKLFRAPNDLEFEKVYKPYILFGKKRYIGNLYEKSPERPPYVDCKGIELKRRDNAPIVKKIYQGAVDIVISKGEEGVNEALTFVRSELNKLISGDYSLDDLVISKSLKDSYKINKKKESIQNNTLINYIETNESNESEIDEFSELNDTKSPDEDKEIASIPHVYLVEKIRKRDPGNVPVSGDRVPFVFIEDPYYPTNVKKASKIYTRSEDPGYVKEHNLKIDIIYYLEQQLRNPLTSFFNLLVDNPHEIFDKALSDYIKKRNGQKSITNFFKPIKIK